MPCIEVHVETFQMKLLPSPSGLNALPNRWYVLKATHRHNPQEGNFKNRSSQASNVKAKGESVLLLWTIGAEREIRRLW